MRSKYSAVLFSMLAALLLALAGCQSPGSSSGVGATVSLTPDLPAVLQQVVGSSASAGMSERMFTATDVWTGTLIAASTTTSDVFTFDWYIYLDQTGNTVQVQSNKTVILFPDTYNFNLLLTNGTQQYVGSELNVTVIDGTNSVPMTIEPVIGDIITDVVVVQELADFIIQYDPGEFGGYTNPELGVIVDNGTELVYALNATSGRWEIPGVYLNLSPGTHSIELKFYSDGTQRGRSQVSQQVVTIVPGVSVTMDLVSLHGEMILVLDEAGGNASFTVNIPSVVVDEAGGTGDLAAVLKVSGPDNPLQSAVLTVVAAGGDYTAVNIFGGMQYGDVLIEVSFSEISTGELLGSCNVPGVTLSTVPVPVQCDLVLRRRAIISGNLLATVGVNVFDVGDEPVLGAPIYANGDFVGLTGGGFGTPGYLKFFVTAGNYDITTQFGGTNYGQNVTLAPLSINNLDITGVLVTAVLFSEGFADNSQGWTLGPEWQIGPATVSSGHCCGNPDPGTDVSPTSDNGVAGVVIGGNASTPLHDYYYLTSPPINAAIGSGVLQLSFMRWLNSDYTNFMNNVVEVFDGTTWVNIWNSGPPPAIFDNTWVPVTHDISAYSNANLQVRFGFNITSSGVFTISSWNLDEVEVIFNP